MIENWYYYLPIIFFTYLSYKAFNKSKRTYTENNNVLITKNYLPLLTISLYLLSSLLIVFVKPLQWYPYFHESSYTFLNFLLYSVLLTIYLIPVLYMKPIYKENFIKRDKLLTLIMILMSILGLYSIIYQFPYALKGLAIGATELRQQMILDNVYLLPQSPLTTLAVGISYFYLFYIGLFFISIIQKRSVFIKISLFIGSLSYLVSGLAFATRDVFIFYGIGFLFVFFYFINILNQDTIKKVRLLYLLFIFILVTFILSISFQRFKDNSNENLSFGTIGYIAQQPFVFSETISEQKIFYEGHNRFPFFISLFTNLKEVKRTTPYEWSFGTFIKDFYSTGGFFFLFFITILIVPIFYIKLRKNNETNFYRHMIITFFYFQFITMGLFYFKLGSNAGNIYMVLLLLIYLSTYFKIKNS
jgi:oligosaccharide repeat unit polymerase